ncbi:MAG TPA: hypothetical protein VFM16_08445 [Holophagaceae bacterium]|nr:hypothetical protein [Holophagaceae bacterium]
MSGAAALLLALPLLAQTQAPASADALARLRAASLAPSPEMARLRALCDGIGGRVTGTPAFERALQWGLDGFRVAGVAARVERFPLRNGWQAGPASVRVEGPFAFSPRVTSWGWSPACDGTYAVVDGGDGGEAALAALGERAKGAFVYLHSEVSQTSGSGPQASMAAQPPSANLDSLAPEACAPSSRAA